MAVIRALKARLTDAESPDDRGNWWSVGLEALAMLRGHKKSRFPIEEMFKETILSVMRNPLDYRDQWRWADCYWDDRIAGSGIEGRALYEAALRVVQEIMDEGSVDHTIRVRCSTPQTVKVFERTAMCIGPRRGKGRSTRVRASKAEHLMARFNEFRNNGRADKACSTCDKDTHSLLTTFHEF